MSADIVCYEQGTERVEPWRGNRAEIGSDLDFLHRLSDERIIRLKQSGSTILVQGRAKVGTIQLPSGRRLVLKTKIPGLVLLEWLAYLNEIPALQVWQRESLMDFDGTLERSLAILYIQSIDRLTRVHIAKGFVPQEITTTQIRGRILAPKLAEAIWRLPRVPQSIRMRSLDIPANQVIALALDRVNRLRPDLPANVQRQFCSLNDAWSQINRSDSDLREMINLAHSCPPVGYRTALILARLILLGARLDPMAGSGGTIFTISLARIWEKSLEKLCRDVECDTGWQVQPRRHCVVPWNDATGESDSDRNLIVDVLLRKGGKRMVLDAKYKCDYGDESRVDRFQMCAYALAFNAQNAVLVYPSNRGFDQPYRSLLKRESLGFRHSIGSICLNMAAGPLFCRRQLSVVLQHAFTD